MTALAWALLASLGAGAEVQPPITIPAEITRDGLIFLQVRVDDSGPMGFVLDSAAGPAIVIDTKRAKSLGLNVQDYGSQAGGAGSDTYRVAWTTDRVTAHLGALDLADRPALVLPLAPLENLTGRRLDGLIGSELFTRYVVEIDYFGQQIRLHEPATYVHSRKGARIPLERRGSHFFVPGTIEMPGRPPLRGRFLVDTAASPVTTLLTGPFARSWNLPPPVQRTVLDRSNAGLGGETKMLIGRATSLALGNEVIREPVFYVSQDEGGALASPDYDGIVGSEVLRRFTVIFDEPRGHMILEPNAHRSEPVEYDASGIRLRASGDDLKTFRIHQVLENSPAERVGLQTGDELVAIDGRSASSFSFDQIGVMLRQPGRQLRLGFERGGHAFSVTITLERLI